MPLFVINETPKEIINITIKPTLNYEETPQQKKVLKNDDEFQIALEYQQPSAFEVKGYLTV